MSKVCSLQTACHNASPQPLENFGIRNASQDGLTAACKECKNDASRLYDQKRDPEVKRAKWRKYSKNRKVKEKLGKFELTSVEDRRKDGHKCLALDVLMVAISDHKKGNCEPEFWYSDSFDTFCDMAGLHPDYVRRNVLEAEA